MGTLIGGSILFIHKIGRATMIKYPIVKQIVREVYKQPIIVLLILDIVAILYLVFKFDVMSFMNASDETAYLEITLPYGFFKGIFMFLLILQCPSIFVDTLNNPLLGIFLTKPVSRAGFLLSKYVGEILAIFALLLTAGVSIVLILYFKIFVALFSFVMFLSFIAENYLVVASIGIIIYFVLTPLILWGEMSGNRLAYLGYIFPPIWELNQIETDIIKGNVINPGIDAFVPILYIVILHYAFCHHIQS